MNIVLDAQGQAIIDSSHTRSKLLYYVCSFFVPAIVQVFFFLEKETVDTFFLFAWNYSVSSKHHYRRNFFEHSSAGYVSSQSGMGTQERGIHLVKFHILYFLWKRKYMWHSKQRVLKKWVPNHFAPLVKKEPQTPLLSGLSSDCPSDDWSTVTFTYSDFFDKLTF